MQTHHTKNFLVTGAAGFIGSCFVRQLCAQGHNVVVLDALTYAGHRENLESMPGPGEMKLVIGDIADSTLVSRLLQQSHVDALINFAAESHVDRSITGPRAFIDTNILGTFSLLTASHAYWAALPAGPTRDAFRYLQISTDEVYGSLGPTGKFHEKLAYEPNSPYSASKASGDHLVRAWHHTYGLPTLTTNCSNNYGPRQFPEKLIPTMITNALVGKKLPVYGDGGNIRDWIHVEDHCHGIQLALTQGKPGETYCFGGNSERNNLDVVRSICAELDLIKPLAGGGKYESLITFVPDRLGHDRRYAIDDTKAQVELGFKRQYTSFEDGLKATIRWYLDNQAWCRAVTCDKKGP